MWSSRTAWVPASPEVVAATGLHVATLPSWHAAVTSVDAWEVADLREPGAAGSALVAVGRREVAASWRVRRRVRDTVHLEVTAADGDDLELLLSFSPWDGGTAVELGVGGRLGGRRLGARDARHRLDASLAALQRRVAVSRPTVLSGPSRRPRRTVVPG